ncbi:hypothetical protein C809_04101 [Lachnospiraceae bacterium MD335]|nr:hypothetical protein C809_04101 [Lachnospiraceae bacterium MD335]
MIDNQVLSVNFDGNCMINLWMFDGFSTEDYYELYTNFTCWRTFS